MFPKAYTFDDILLIPTYSEVKPTIVDLKTRFSKKIDLNIPLVSSAMDTVTESKLAICLAQQGGIGVIHRNLSIDEQVKEVRIVKRSANGIIHQPAVMSPNITIESAEKEMIKKSVSSFPIVENNKVVGIMTKRDLGSQINAKDPISSIMTKNVITALEGTTLDEAKQIMHKFKIEKLVIVNSKKELKGLICLKDIRDNFNYPHATKDKDGRLRVAAAIGTDKKEFERAEKLVSTEVDALVIDTAHGHHKDVISMLKRLKKNFERIDIVVGNVAVDKAAKILIEGGADAIKVGIGPGSICTTRMVTGVGVPQVTAILDVCKVAKELDVPVIADGGIKYSGDIAKALALGASSVMIGSLFCWHRRSTGEKPFLQMENVTNCIGEWEV